MNFKKKSKFLVSIFFCILVISFLAPFSFADNLVAPAQICQIFPDKGFAEAITRHLGKKSMYEFVTQKELNKIKIFVQMGTKEISTKISNINGIQYL
ncbi:MAG: hypothetical protein LBK29_03805, partial [Oscillospiraceae bacterium]|nr:hypothetical protein [Oscillospiraceae bacterium]